MEEKKEKKTKFTMISNEVLEELAKIKLNATQFRLILVIWRYTLGFQRKEHDLSTSFLSEATGCDKRQIQRELKKLEDRKIIVQNIKPGSYRKISFNENIVEWVGEITNGEFTNGKSTNGRNTISTTGKSTNSTDGKSTTQEINNLNKNLNKDNSRKQKVYDKSSIYYQLALRLLHNIRRNNPDFKPNFNERDIQRWANDCRLMVERDKRTEEQIAYLMDWVQQDSFWKANILSPAKLRKQFDRLIMQVSERKKNNVHILPKRPYKQNQHRPLTEDELRQLREMEKDLPF